MTERVEPERPCPERPSPVRTCIGCRARSAKSELLRVTVDADRVDDIHLVPDPRGRRPGRGAYLHPTSGCLSLAERRRAFGRALRLTGLPDLSAVWAAVDRTTGSPLEGRTTQ